MLRASVASILNDSQQFGKIYCIDGIALPPKQIMVTFIPKQEVAFLRILLAHLVELFDPPRIVGSWKEKNCDLKKEVHLRIWQLLMSCIYCILRWHPCFVSTQFVWSSFSFFLTRNHFSNLASVEDVGRILRGEALIAMDWSRAKSLQCKAEHLLKLMEEKKKAIWNFSVANRNEETDKVSSFYCRKLSETFPT